MKTSVDVYIVELWAKKGQLRAKILFRTLFTIFVVGSAKQMETKQKTRGTDANMMQVLIKFHSHTNI